ncbi:hypothetical protein ACFQ1S_21255, partial [Kibdelosporangium lantanae]
MVTHTLTAGQTAEVVEQITHARNRFANLGNILRHPRARGIGLDALALVVAVLDVWLIIPKNVETYSVVLSAVACTAMLFHRRWPFLAVLVTVPGYLAGPNDVYVSLSLVRRPSYSWPSRDSSTI